MSCSDDELLTDSFQEQHIIDVYPVVRLAIGNMVFYVPWGRYQILFVEGRMSISFHEVLIDGTIRASKERYKPSTGYMVLCYHLGKLYHAQQLYATIDYYKYRGDDMFSPPVIKNYIRLGLWYQYVNNVWNYVNRIME